MAGFGAPISGRFCAPSDIPPKCKGVFVPDRVQFTYIKGDGGNKVLVMDRARTPMRGTVTGEVEFSNDFWVAVKPKNGPMDGYAISWPPGDMVARIKALKKGDRVSLTFALSPQFENFSAVFPRFPLASADSIAQSGVVETYPLDSSAAKLR